MSTTARPPALPARRRRWLKWCAALLGGGVVFVLALPVWWPWVFMPALERAGVSAARYQREGAGRLALFEVAFTNTATEATAARVTVNLPHRWLLDRLGWSRAGAPAQLELEDWQVRVLPRAGGDPPSSTSSLATVLDQVVASWDRAGPWLRLVECGSGQVVMGGRTTLVESIIARRESLGATMRDPALPGTVELEVQRPGKHRFEIGSSMEDVEVGADLALERIQGAWVLDGHANWRTNELAINARAGASGWLPDTLEVVATDWMVPGVDVGLKDYGEVTGGFDFSWTNRQYRFLVTGEATATSGNRLLPDVQVDISGQGDFKAARVDRLSINTPALRVELSDPVAIDFTGRLQVPETTLRVSADLENWNGLPFTGSLEGVIAAREAADEPVVADFTMNVSQLKSAWLEAERAAVSGTLRWPDLTVDEGSFTLPGGGSLRLSGGIDVIDRALTHLNWSFSGSLPADWRPEGLTVARVEAVGSATGTWPEVEHRTEVELRQPEWRGAVVDRLRLSLNGMAAGTNEWELQLARDQFGLEGAGGLDLGQLDRGGLAGVVRSFSVTTGAGVNLQLEQPAGWQVSWRAGDESRLTARLEPLQLAGAGRWLELAADVAWPTAGTVFVSATNVATADVAGWWAGSLPDIVVRGLRVSGRWDEGPLDWSSEIDGSWTEPSVGELDLRARIEGDGSGVRFVPVTVTDEGSEILSVRGVVPARVLPAGAPTLQWLDEGVFDLQIDSQPDARLSERIRQHTGVAVEAPRVRVSASGNPTTLRAEVELAARALRRPGPTDQPPVVPPASNLLVTATLDRLGISVRRGSFSVAGQTARFSGRLPVEASSWGGWWTALRSADWRSAEAELDLPQIAIADLNPWLGEALTPRGSATAHLRLEKGGAVVGHLNLTNLALPPIEPVGSVRDIAGRIEFKDRKAEVKSLSAQLSGQPVRAGGVAEWSINGLVGAEVFLQATNVPLVRSPDLFLRGNLDVRLVAGPGAAPRITGEVLLNDSLLFQDIGNFIAIDLQQPERRPPFFSVTRTPFADWGLDVRVRGQKFLRVLSPVFKGSVSAGLQLGGTLKEPVALGEVSVENGQVLFPFGTLEVTRGAVQLNRQEPHQPRLNVRGQGMNFGHQITMDISGTAGQPNVTFTSVPPLSTREIVLMLTAGEIPGGSYHYSDADKAGKLGYFLGKEFVGQLLGMDTGEERLLFRTGEYVTDDGQLTYRIEYRLVDWLSLFGEYTRFRDYNGGLKFNLYSR